MEKRKSGVTVLFAILILGIWYYRERLYLILEPFGWGLVIAFLFVPIAKKLEKKVSPCVSVFVIYGTLAVFLFLLFWWGVPFLKSGMQSFPDVWNQVESFLSKLPFDISYLQSFFSQKEFDLMGTLSSWGGGIIRFLVGVVLSVYFLKDRKKLGEGSFEILPERFRGAARETFSEIKNMFGSFVCGRFLLSVAVGVLTFLMMVLCKLPYAFPLSLLAAFLDILPFFGPLLSGIPIAVLALTESIGKGVLVIFLLLAIQQVENLLLTPKIMGDYVGLHPIVTILAVLTGASFFGIFGMLLAVPVFAGVKILIKRIFSYLV